MKICLSSYKTKRFHSSIILFLFAFLLLSCIMFLLCNIKPVFEDKARCAAQKCANDILNETILTTLSFIDYNNVVTSTIQGDDRISSVITDTEKLNIIKSKVYEIASEKLKNAEEVKIYIPTGSLTNYPVLQSMGHRIPVKIVFDTNLKIDFSYSLKEAGINQVFHEIFIVANANVDIISSVITTSETVSVRIPISQTLIVGDVPTSYGYSLNSQRR